MSNEFDEGKKSPAGRRNSAIHQEESLRWAREHESRIRLNSGGAGAKRGTANASAVGIHRKSPADLAGNQRKPGKEKKQKGSKTRRRIITMIIAECFALLFIFGYGFVARRWNMIQRLDDWQPEEVQNQNFSVDLPQYENQKGHWGIYIFGVDSRGTNVSKGTNADVNMICDIDQDTGEIRLVSVFRDTYLNIDDDNQYNKINHAYFTGGPNDAAKALNKNLDLNITDFVTFNWKAVADAINILGGIDMEISKAEFYYINSFITETVEATGVYSTHLKKAGMNHLDGVQAVAYGRLRLMDTDYARTERQRKVIQAAFDKVKTADWAILNQLAVTIFPQVATSVDLADILNLLTDVGKYHIGDTGGFPFARGEANMGRKGACVIPQTLESNVIELHQFLYDEEDYTPSNTVKNISAKISSDTGMYKQGVSIDHVSTDGGVIPTQPKTTEASKETKETEETSLEESGKETEETVEAKETESGTGDERDEESSSSASGKPGQEESSRYPTAEPKPSDEESSSSGREESSSGSRETTGGDRDTEETSRSHESSSGEKEQETTAERKPDESTSSSERETAEAPSKPSSSGPSVSPTRGTDEVITVPEAPIISYEGPDGTEG